MPGQTSLEEKLRGEITAYLSLIFILLVTFMGAMLESASIQTAKNYYRADMERAVECIFAEYQKELLEKYDIFALEGSYETGSYSEDGLFRRLAYYGADSMEQNIKRIRFLTDNGCEAFCEQVAFYMKHKYGLSKAEGLLGKADLWRRQEEEAGKYGQLEAEKQEELSRLLEENEGELPDQDNPVAHFDQLKTAPLLTLVAPGDMQVSEKSVLLSELASHRSLNKGYGDFTDVSEPSRALSDILLGEYVLEHFSAASSGKRTGALDYEIEYILEGRASDRENLEKVSEKLLLLRFVPNYAYIQTDSEMRAEASGLALTLCSLLAVPAITEAVAQVILLAWAYGESILDIRTLLSGNRVPLAKTKESWQLGLSSLLTLGTAEDRSDGADTESGLKYEEYLRILLFLEKKENVAVRSLDMIEQNLRTREGKSWFFVDYCVSKAEFLSTCTFRRGITYCFPTYFGYR